MKSIAIHPEVEDALRLGRPVVALETAVVTAGLPRTPLRDGFDDQQWSDTQPVNLEVALLMQRLVREWSAVPATVAVLDGTLHIGLEDDQLQQLAADVQEKASVTNLATVMIRGGSAGTTVSATLAACRLTPRPIRVFATGGIGGVHRNWAKLPDISADLRQMAQTPTCVVCAGAKSILDLPATLEALEALCVPVIGYCTHRFAQFQSLGDDSLRTRCRLDDVASIARMCRLHWEHLSNDSGVLVANPIPEDAALDRAELERATAEAERRARDAGAAAATGAARTPFLLSHIAALTDGRSLRANVALLANNARLAGELACALCTTE